MIIEFSFKLFVIVVPIFGALIFGSSETVSAMYFRSPDLQLSFI